MTASLPVGQGTLAAEYEPRLRFFSSIPEVGETSHFAAARLELPLGSRTLVRLAHRYTRATLETTVVDPGREYFFDLERYTYNESSALARVDVGSRAWVEGEGRISWNRFDEQQQAGFFDYDHRALRAGLGYDIAQDLRASVSYSYDRLPPSPDRAIVESGAHSVIGALAGTLGPQTQATVQAGFRHQSNPQATGESRSYDGLDPRRLAAPRARKRDVRRAGVQPLDRPVSATTRTPTTSTTRSCCRSMLRCPSRLSLRGAVGWLRNDYPNVAAPPGSPSRAATTSSAGASGSAATWAGAASSAPTTAAIGAPRTSRATTSRRPGS